MMSKSLDFEDNAVVIDLYGEYGNNLKLIEDALGVDITARGNQLTISGDAAGIDIAQKTCQQLYRLVKQGYPLQSRDVEFAVSILSQDPDASISDIFLDKLTIRSGKRTIAPKTINQKFYVEAIRKSDIVFAIGPAGTGKTYLAMAMAVSALLNEEISRIIMVFFGVKFLGPFITVTLPSSSTLILYSVDIFISFIMSERCNEANSSDFIAATTSELSCSLI